MAEVLGVVASGISVASFAIQLAESIKKLKEFVDDVRDAPEDIKYTIHELDTLNLQLADIERELQQNPASIINNTSLQKCLSLCQNGTTALESLVKDLETEMKTRRRKTAVKTWFKKGVLEKYDKRLERAKSSLMLSYLIYTKDVQTKLIIEVRQAVLSQPAAAFTVNTTTQEDMGPKRPRSDERAHARRRYKFSIATWLIAKAWNITLSRSAAGWDVQLRTYAVLPRLSPIFSACREGDLETIKRLFSSGLTSPFCTDETGQTPLHNPIGVFIPRERKSHSRPRAARAQSVIGDNLGRTAYVRSCTSQPAAERLRVIFQAFAISHVAMLNLYRLLFDPDMEFFDGKYVGMTLFWPSYAVDILHEQCWPPYQDIPLLQRLSYALIASHHWQNLGPKDFEARLGCKLVQCAVLDTAFANDAILGFLATIMQAYGRSMALNDGRDAETGGWSEVLVHAITRNVDLQDCRCVEQPSSGCRTAMTNFVQGCIDEVCPRPVNYEEHIERAIDLWSSSLDNKGVHLDTFAKSESKALEAFAALDSASSYMTVKGGRGKPHLSWIVKLQGMKKSSQSGHWQLCFDRPPRRLYQLLGRPRSPSGVPGAWGNWDLDEEETDTWEEETKREEEIVEWWRERQRRLSEEANDEANEGYDTRRIVEEDANDDEEIEELETTRS